MNKTLLSAKLRLKGFLNCASGKQYPTSFAVFGPNDVTLDFIRSTDCNCVAEIGIFQGSTSEGFAKFLKNTGALHLFDFENTVSRVKRRLNELGYTNVHTHGNSTKTMDSYNWSLMRVLQMHESPIFDYVLIDGAHTWNIDALTFCLTDRLLKVGGYVDFDDYSWSLEHSQSLNPLVFPLTARQYTDEQIREPHVKLIVDLLVKRDPRYEEIVENKIFRKVNV